MSDLADRDCVTDSAGLALLTDDRLAEFAAEVADWQIVDGHHLTRQFAFTDFVSALDFVNRVGAVAEAAGHHPDIHLAWGKVRVVVWTHAVGGLTENDFILAAKIDAVS